MADEFQTPKEFTTPSEFPEVKEVYVNTPEFLDQAIGYGTTGQKSKKSVKSRASQLRKMMMYLAAIVSTMGSLLAFTSAQSTFDKKLFFMENRDWYSPVDDAYIYLADDGWGWIAERTEDGKIQDDFCHYRRWRYDIDDGGEYEFTGRSYEIDWSQAVIDGRKADINLKVVKSENGYVIQAASADNPSEPKTLVPVEPSKTNYPGRQYMMKYVKMPLADILEEFGTFVHEGDAPVYEYIHKITFGPEGKGTFLINGKEDTFTYSADEDPASSFITITHKGKTARGYIDFHGEKPTLMLFGGLEGFPDSFAAFIAADPDDPAEASDKGGPDGTVGTDASSPESSGPAAREAADASECLRDGTDWFCRDKMSYIHIGRNGEGFIFTEKNDESEAYYKRMTFTTEGSICTCRVENFSFPTFDTVKYTIECFKTSHGYELLLTDGSGGAKRVYEEYPSKLQNYMTDLVSRNTDDILMRFRNFHINDYGPMTDAITHLEFTTRDAGHLTINDEKHQFRYEIVEKGINTTFYLYYEDQKYLGRIHYGKDRPGIQLFNPQMDGTFGPFAAAE